LEILEKPGIFISMMITLNLMKIDGVTYNKEQIHFIVETEELNQKHQK
jgi:hypothetical protein